MSKLENILQKHPEIHVDQARNGKWNFRHDDNLQGPDAEYFGRGCFASREDAIRAAFNEYDVEINEAKSKKPHR